jgi:hypothetical protein
MGYGHGMEHRRRHARWTARAILAACFIVLAPRLHADPDPRIALRDLPGTDGEWQEGAALVPAPRERVHAWLVDYANWPKNFPDMLTTEVFPDDDRGRHVVRFSSKIAGMTFVLFEEVRPTLLVFEGFAPHVHTQGRIHLIDRGDGTTRVLMHSTSEVHGFIGLFATKAYRRKSAFAVSTAHLQALLALAERR